MEAIEDFELLGHGEYSNFDQSEKRHLEMAELFEYFVDNKEERAEQDYLSYRRKIFGDFWFRGKSYAEIKNTRLGLAYVADNCSRILAQFKVKTGYLLIVDCDSTRRVLRLPGLDIMYGKPHIGVLFFNNELEYVFAQWFCARCIQRRFGLRLPRYRKVERFNPLLDWKVVDEWTVDLRLLGRAWMRVQVMENPPKGYLPMWGYPYEMMPNDLSLFNSEYGPHYFRIKPCFRLSQLNDGTLYSAINYLLRGSFFHMALRP